MKTVSYACGWSCLHCGTEERYIKSNRCVQCEREKAKERKRKRRLKEVA